jgi:hypothetical protein
MALYTPTQYISFAEINGKINRIHVERVNAPATVNGKQCAIFPLEE